MAGGGVVVALGPVDSTVPGWTYRAAALDTGCPGDCAPGGPPTPPTFSADGTAYVTTGDDCCELSTIALDGQGRLRPGWPYPLPVTEGTEAVVNLTMSPSGVLFVSHLVITSGSGTLFPLSPDGEPAP